MNGEWDKKENIWRIKPVAKILGIPIPPDPSNPSHFIHFKDRNGEKARVILDGGGLPADVPTGTNPGTGDDARPPGSINVRYYQEADFLLLGISPTLNGAIP